MTPLRQRMTRGHADPQPRAAHATRLLQQVSLFARHFGKSPELLGPADIRAYQLHLIRERQLSASSVVVAVAAIRFLYKVTLKRGWNIEEVVPDLPQAAAASRRTEPARRSPVPRCGREPEAPRHPDRLLRRGAAHLGGGPPDAGGNRQPAHGHPCRAGQRTEGPLRHALAQAAGHCCADYWRSARPKEWLFPGDLARATDLDRRRRGRLQNRAAPIQHRQAGHAARAAPRLCRPPARSRRRSAHHPVAARPSQPEHHGPVPAPRDQQGMRDGQPAGCVAAALVAAIADRPRTRLSARPMRAVLEVADMFRRYGAAYRQAHADRSPRRERRVMAAIEALPNGRRSAGMSSNATTAAISALRLQLLPRPALPEVPGSGARRMAGGAPGRAAAGALLPRRLHRAGAGRRHRLPQQAGGLRHPVPGRGARRLRGVAADPAISAPRSASSRVLHTWGQSLLHHHPHLHCLVPGGGISPDGTGGSPAGPASSCRCACCPACSAACSCASWTLPFAEAG